MTRLYMSCLGLLLFSPGASGEDLQYRGHYTQGAEVRTFSACDNDDQLWVSGTTYVLADLDEFIDANREQPYQAVYVEFRGHPHQEHTGGFAADHDGIVHISEVIAWRHAGEPGCDRAAGENQPSPVKGVDLVETLSPAEYRVHSLRGIGAIQVYRPPWSRMSIDLVYEEENRFGGLEGLTVTDVNTRQSISVDQLNRDGVLLLLGTRLMIMPRGEPINWRIDFVDFYR